MLRQKHGIREGSRLASMLIYLATGLCCIVTVYPMYYVLIRSVSAPEHALAGDMLLFPKGFDLNSYRVILSDTTLWRAYGNTLLYVVVTTLLMLLFCTLCAYPLCMPGLLGKKAVVTYLLVCCFSERMRKLFRKNEKNVLRFCNKKAKEKRRLQRVKKPM